MNSCSFLENIIVIYFEFVAALVRHAGEHGRKYRYPTGFRCLFEFVHKVHIFVRVYLDAGGRDVFVAQNAAQYFSDYPPPSYLATLSIRAITLFATSEKDFVFMLFGFGRG